MIAGLPLSFAEPFLLLGLLSLPALWWLLRVMPPRPRRIEFPPTRLLFDIAPKEETPSRTPWWLTALRLAAAALVILAAAGPIWNPQTGVAGSNAPLLILLDDGWSAAASWDVRIKAADELIANADNDRRGVALVPLSEPARDITLMPAGTARVALRQFVPKPYSIERVETLGRHRAFPESDRQCRDRLADRQRRYRARTGIHRSPGQDHRGSRLDDLFGRHPAAAGSGRGRKRRGQDDGEGAARRGRRHRRRRRPCARPERLADRRGPLRLCAAGPRDRGGVRSSGRIAQRYRAAGNLRRALRRRGAAARQALAPPRHRHRLRIDQRYRAAAAGLDLLSHPRAGAVRRRAARRSRRAAAGDHAIPRPEAADDRAGRCRHAVAGNSRTHQCLDRARRRAGALCRPAAGPGRRRSGAGKTAPRRTQPRRQPDLGKAAAPGILPGRRPVRGPRRAEGRHRQPAGAGRTGCGAGEAELGLAGRRHAAGHRRASRQGRGQPVPCQRRHALVGPADVGKFCRDAATDRRCLRLYLQPRRRRRGRNQRGNRGAAAHARRFWCVRTATLDRKTLARRFSRSRHAGTSARLLRPGRRSARGQRAGGGGPHRGARYVFAAGAARHLHQCRAARSQGNAAVGVAGAVPDRRRHRRHARRRHRGAVAAACGRRRAGAGLRDVHDGGDTLAGTGRHHRRFRHQGGLANETSPMS